MANPRHWMRGVLIGLGALLACCAAVVYLADPYQVYRLARWFTPPYGNGEQAYYNAGLARHSDYDAAFFGTSMVENTLVSQVDARFGTRCIKLPFEGGMAGNHAEALRVAFSTRKLTHNDIILMVTDGVTEAAEGRFEKEGWLTETLRGCRYQNPQDVADYILEEAERISGSPARDDMTVLAARVWER